MKHAGSMTIGLTLIFACTATAQMPATKVVVAEASLQEAPATISLVGTVRPVRRSFVSSEMGGLVMELPVRQGDRVKASDVLCRLNSDTIRLGWMEAKARLGALESRLQELRNGSRVEEVARHKAMLDEAIAEQERWQFEMARIETLYEGRDSNAKEYTDTRMQFIAADRRKAAAEAMYEMTRKGPREEVVVHAAHEVSEQQAVVDRLQKDLEKTVIRAPFDGAVVELATEVGQWVMIGGRIAQMIDLNTMLVRVDVPESALPFVMEGAKARVQVDALKKTLDGAVKHVIRQADDRARTFPVEVELVNEKAELAGGMFARVTLPAGPVTQVVTVPKDAIVEHAGSPHVAIVFPGKDGALSGVLAPVTVGVDVETWISIASDKVQPGTRVIVRGNERMMPFPSPVEIVDERGTPVLGPKEAAAPPADARPKSEGGKS